MSKQTGNLIGIGTGDVSVSAKSCGRSMVLIEVVVRGRCGFVEEEVWSVVRSVG